MNVERKRILVIDDEPSASTLLQLYFETSSTYEVKVENVPAKALAVAEKYEPDLIFLDLNMPDLSGDELANHFSASPKLKKVPVVFLTSMVTRDEVSFRGGMIAGRAFLAKPATRRDVLDCVVQHLGIDAMCRRRMENKEARNSN